MNKGFLNSSIALLVATMFIVIGGGCGTEKNINARSTWEVADTTKLTNLIIAEGAGIKAPDGYMLTMTVDGVEVPIKAGAYRGDIVITVKKS